MSASQSEAIILTNKQRHILTQLCNEVKPTSPIARRAELLLKIANGNRTNSQIAREEGVSYAMVKTWRNRWLNSKDELVAVEDAGTTEAVLTGRIRGVLASRSVGTKRNASATSSRNSVQPNKGQDVLQSSVEQEPSRDSTQITNTTMAASESQSAELFELRQQIEALQEENADLNLMFETMTEHSDALSDELHQEKEDLEFILEMTTEHSDIVSEELQEKAEEALRESERRLRLIVQATPVPVIITCIADQTVQYANHMTGPLLGLADEDVTSRKLTEFFMNPSDWQRLMEELGKNQAVDEFEMEMRQADDNQVWVTVSMRPLEFDENPSVLAAFHDITERKMGEIRLQRQVEKLRSELDDARHNSIVAEQSGTAFFSNMDAIEIKHTGVQMVAFHSFRGGAGKSFIVANIAALLAASGQRVGVIDASLQSPSTHMFFGIGEQTVNRTFNDLLWQQCTTDEAAYDVTEHIDLNISGKLFLIPSSTNPGQMAQVLSEGYPADRLTNNIHEIAESLELDILLIDTHPGLNEEALLTMGIAHAAVIVLRPEQQDYEGTGIAIQIARKLQIPSLSLVVNQVPAAYESAAVRTRVEETFTSPVAAVLPYAPSLASFDGSSIFAIRHPEHPLSLGLQRIASGLLGVREEPPSSPSSDEADMGLVSGEKLPISAHNAQEKVAT